MVLQFHVKQTFFPFIQLVGLDYDTLQKDDALEFLRVPHPNSVLRWAWWCIFALAASRWSPATWR